MQFLERIILKYPLWIVLLLALVTAALLPGLFERRTDVEIESFLSESVTSAVSMIAKKLEKHSLKCFSV